MRIAATVDLESAPGRVWDVAVVGAGPAGATAAYELARRGLNVLLIDRAAFPRYKVCGCCLNANALATLKTIGLGSLTVKLEAVPIGQIYLATASRSVNLRLAGGVALSREAFDAALIRAAIQQGVAFLPETRATLGLTGRGSCRLQLEHGASSSSVEARVIVAADGLGGSLLQRAGIIETKASSDARIGIVTVLDPNAAIDFFKPGTIYMACTKHGYLGITRLEDGRLDLAGAFDATFIRESGTPVEAARQTLLDLRWPIAPEMTHATWKGTPPLTRQANAVAAESIFVLGDAAGYVEPFTGEGMAWALSAAVLLGPLVEKSVRAWQSSFAHRWEALYRSRVRRRQIVCHIAAGLLRRPALVGRAIDLLRFIPSLSAPIVALLNRPTLTARPIVNSLPLF